MATKIIKESQVRRIFKEKQISEGAIEWLDDHIHKMLTDAYKSIKDNDRIKRVSKGIAEFMLKPNALITDDGLDDDDDDEGDK